MLKFDQFSSFELQAFEIQSTTPVLCAVIYPPPKANKDCISELVAFFADIVLKYDKILVMGDFNVHVCCPTNPLAKYFISLIDFFGFQQMVNGPTHTHGHTLDLVPVVSDIIIEDFIVSDHNPILCTVSLPCQPSKFCPAKRWLRPLMPSKHVEFNVSFMETLQGGKVDLLSPHLSVEEAVNIFNSECTETLDSVVPLRQVCRNHKSAPWYNEHIKSLRRQCRRCERKWKKDKLQISYEMLRDSLGKFQRAVKMARSRYFSDVLENNRRNPKVIFSTIDSFLNPRLEVPGDMPMGLCENLLDFFVGRM